MEARQPLADKLPVGQERIKLLYEEYVHYSWLKQVWDEPLTDKPELEPCCAAAFHGIELAFLLMAEFVTDKRMYVAKRPRVEAMALDIRAQMQLLAEIVDGELEEEGQCSWASLTQDFPFEGCPPTTSAPASSPGLSRLIDAVTAVKESISFAELNSLIKVTLQVTSAFQAAFQRWSVGLGIEHQFNTLLQLLGLKQRVPERSTNLDYMAMFRPNVALATLTQECYENDEDFFFRTIHLGTECWMFIANNRARSAAAFAKEGDWHIASARIMQAARILHYLGDHIMTLTRMNLRDYLQLKVQLEGTSGAGSSQVRAIRGLVSALMEPLSEQVRRLVGPAVGLKATTHTQGDVAPGEEDEVLLQGIMTIYINCDKHAGLYNYAKALEDIESALLGGFFYKHYCLAANVIGSEARGTMRRAVAGLKSGYEKPLFPVLDAARCKLGARYDEELSHLKGKMMDEIMTKYASFTGNRAERQQAMIPPAVSSLARDSIGSSSATSITSINSSYGPANLSTTAPGTKAAGPAGLSTVSAKGTKTASDASVTASVTGTSVTVGRNDDLVSLDAACLPVVAKAAEVAVADGSGPAVSGRGLCPFMADLAVEGSGPLSGRGTGQSEVEGVSGGAGRGGPGVAGQLSRLRAVAGVSEGARVLHQAQPEVGPSGCPFFS